jgi:pilus assembly protein CpaB
MKPARLIVLGVALFAGAIAFMLSGREAPPPQVTVVQPAMDMVDILVAKSDIQLGSALKPEDLSWQAWPSAAASPQFIRKNARPAALDEFKGAITRAPFIAGEPIREQKLIKANGSGFMSAILSPGMRAISTDISPETGVGGFILPNDRVDVLLTRRDPDSQKQSGGDGFVSETVLRNVRVLAIDQQIEEKNGQKVVVGKTATLELAPRQTETLALSRQRGTLSLALRSLAESKPSARTGDDDESDRASGSVNFVRYGINSVQVLK